MALKTIKPNYSEVWLFDPDPIKGNEIGTKIRPCLILSNNFFNYGPSGVVIIIPITSVNKGVLSHVPITPPQGGLAVNSYAVCEQIRAISKSRLLNRIGFLTDEDVMRKIQNWIIDLITET